MSLIGEIASAYRDPTAALSDQRARGIDDPQTLFHAMLFGFLNFVATLPALAVQATAERPLFALAAANLVVMLFALPLVLFALAGLCALAVSWTRATISWRVSRRVVAWSALVSAPFVLLTGLAGPVAPWGVVTLLQSVTGFVFLRQLIIGLNHLKLTSGQA